MQDLTTDEHLPPGDIRMLLIIDMDPGTEHVVFRPCSLLTRRKSLTFAHLVLPYARPADIGIATMQDFGLWVMHLRNLVKHLGIESISTRTHNIIDDRIDPRLHQFNINNFLSTNTTTDGTQTDDTIYRFPTNCTLIGKCSFSTLFIIDQAKKLNICTPCMTFDQP